MKQKLTITLFLSIFLWGISTGQDIHFTNYNFSPLYLSPAKTGSFLGSYRFAANARTQFNSFIVKPYRTVMASADMNIDFGLKDHHWIGAGLNIHSDQAGDLSFQNNGVHLSLAYHYALDPKYKTIITLGLQAGATQRTINSDNYSSFETLSKGTDPDLLLLDNFNPTITDFNVGVSFKRMTTKTNYIDMGLAVNHLTQSEFQFSGSGIRNVVARRVNAYVEYHIQSSKQLAIKPIIVYSRMFNFQNLFGQFNLEYKPNRKKDTLIKGGLGYRNGDALQILAGMYYKEWDVGLAYDLTVSSAANLTNRFGGLEIGIKRIIIANKKPDEEPPAILCPHF